MKYHLITLSLIAAAVLLVLACAVSPNFGWALLFLVLGGILYIVIYANVRVFMEVMRGW